MSIGLEKLNLGCGHRVLAGWTNVDVRPDVGAEVTADLCVETWPWPDGSVSEVLFNHSLEHMQDWQHVLRQLCRVCAHGARVEIHVPHPRHDDWLNDPTHAWCPTPAMLAMLSRRVCAHVRAENGANTPLAELLGVDFELTRTEYVPEAEYAALAGDPAMERLIRERNNVIKEVRMELRVVKEYAEGAGE